MANQIQPFDQQLESGDPAPGLAGMHSNRDTYARVSDLSKTEAKQRLDDLFQQRETEGPYSNLEVELRAIEARLRELDDLQAKWVREEARRVHWIADRHVLTLDGERVPFEEAGQVAEFASSRVGRLIVAALNGAELPERWRVFLADCTAEPRKVVR
ncbi:hypothetical protein BH24ACT26_BH24ACT26_08060 [soil metagenome]